MATASYSPDDSTIYLFTSLTAGSSHIITATSRLETILKAHKIPFRAVDCATDEKARMLWGRRSRGKKLPGLVKYGSILGDLEQIEEWNEYGELKDQIEAADDFSGAPITSTITPTSMPQTSAQKPDPPSRTASEARHISISEPGGKESGGNSAAKSNDNNMSATMRQLGAEAAAKASERKASGSKTSRITAPSASPSTSDSNSKTANPAATKLAAEMADPSQAPSELTDAKTPDQLVAQGERRASSEGSDELEQSEATATPPLSSAPPSETLTDSKASTQEQLLAAQRRSSLTKQPSRLAESTPLAQSHTVAAESDDEIEGKDKDQDKSEGKDTNTASPELESKFGQQQGARASTELGSSNEADATRVPSAGASSSSEQLPKTRTHRGSSISDASREEIRAAEEKNRIMEESEEEEQAIDESESGPATTSSAAKTKAKDMQSSNKVEKEVTKGHNPQDGGAKDEDAVGISVGD